MVEIGWGCVCQVGVVGVVGVVLSVQVLVKGVGCVIWKLKLCVVCFVSFSSVWFFDMSQLVCVVWVSLRNFWLLWFLYFGSGGVVVLMGGGLMRFVRWVMVVSVVVLLIVCDWNCGQLSMYLSLVRQWLLIMVVSVLYFSVVWIGCVVGLLNMRMLIQMFELSMMWCVVCGVREWFICYNWWFLFDCKVWCVSEFL